MMIEVRMPVMAERRVADWRLPTEKPQRAQRMARKMQGGALDRSPVDKAPSVTRAVGPADDTPDAYWNALLCDPRANVGDRKKPLPVQRLGEIVPHIFGVECLKCFRIIEVQTADAVRLYGDEAVWRDVGKDLLEGGCQSRTGNRDNDRCWPDYERA
jgi:hypothetical protein